MTHAEEEKRKANKKMRQNLHHFAKGLGLELIVGLLLSCLADPKTSLFQWCVHRKGRQSGGDCATRPSRNSGPVANAHVKKALKESGRKRVYCIMVSRAALNDSRMRRQLEEAPGKLDEEVHERAKFLVFGICEMRYIGYRLHKFYCRGPTNVRPVTGDVLSALLDSLLAHITLKITESKPFTQGCTGLTFAKLLKEYTKGKQVERHTRDIRRRMGRPRVRLRQHPARPALTYVDSLITG